MSALYSVHLFSSQISIRLWIPAKTTFESSLANSFKKSGTRIRPTESTSTSAAPDKKNRLKLLVSAVPSGSSPILAVIFSHSFSGYTKRQLSRPRVTTSEVPRSIRHLDGTDSRFLGSNVCLYSPINMILIVEKFAWKPTTILWSGCGRVPSELFARYTLLLEYTTISHHMYTIHHFAPPRDTFVHHSSG